MSLLPSRLSPTVEAKQLKLLSVVLPVFNEEENLPDLLPAICQSLGEQAVDFEVIVVDDGSFDASVSVVKQLIELHPQVSLLQLTRNFGHQIAITAGIEAANGNVVITMDADGQDPAELLPLFIEKWKQGALVVFGKRILRHDNWFKRLSASVYYELLYRFSDIKIKGSIGDFRLMDESVVRQLSGIKEKSKYLRGLVSWLGYPYDFVEYDRPNRKKGKTKFSLLKMVRLAMDGILNFSLVPIRLGLFLGILFILLGLFFLVYITVDTLAFDKIYPLYKWISVVTFMAVGFLFVLIWILAEYIGMIHEQARTRPPYVVKETVNFKSR